MYDALNNLTAKDLRDRIVAKTVLFEIANFIENFAYEIKEEAEIEFPYQEVEDVEYSCLCKGYWHGSGHPAQPISNFVIYDTKGNGIEDDMILVTEECLKHLP